MAGYLVSSFSGGALVARLGVGRLLLWSGLLVAASAACWAVDAGLAAAARGRVRVRPRRRSDRRRDQRVRGRPLHAARDHLAARLLGPRRDARPARDDGGDRLRPRLARRLRGTRGRPARAVDLASGSRWACGTLRSRRPPTRAPPARSPPRAAPTSSRLAEALAQSPRPAQRARLLPLHGHRGDRRPVGLHPAHGVARHDARGGRDRGVRLLGQHLRRPHRLRRAGAPRRARHAAPALHVRGAATGARRSPSRAARQRRS